MTGADGDLMMRYARGDAAAFDMLYAQHKDAVYRYFLRQLPAPAAQDCHQETWLAVIRHRDRYESRGQFRAWLFTLAHNVMVNRFRAEARAPVDDLPDIEGPALITVMERADTWQQVQDGIRALPLHQRDALVLQQEGGFSLHEIAEITGSGVEGVKSRLRYAMAKLRSSLGGGSMDE